LLRLAFSLGLFLLDFFVEQFDPFLPIRVVVRAQFVIIAVLPNIETVMPKNSVVSIGAKLATLARINFCRRLSNVVFSFVFPYKATNLSKYLDNNDIVVAATVSA
jgi:hypothetical protein